MDCLISSSFFVLSLIKCLSSDLFFPRLFCVSKIKTGAGNRNLWTSKALQTGREACVSCCQLFGLSTPTPVPSSRQSNPDCWHGILPSVIQRWPDTHHLFLPLVVSGNNVMGLVHAVGAGGADAGVVCPAVVVQETLVFLTDLLFQVESGFDEPVGGERLHLQRMTWWKSAQFKTG